MAIQIANGCYDWKTNDKMGEDVMEGEDEPQ
jgi:hypothetical protein